MGSTNWPCPLWKACDPQIPDIVTAQGDALVVALIVLVLGGLFLLVGLGRGA